MVELNIIGRLTKDVTAVTVSTENGELKKAVLSIAGLHRAKEETTFVEVVAWGEQARNAGEYLKKGSLVHVVATVKNNNYVVEDKMRYGFNFNVKEIEYLSPKPKEGGSE